MPHSHTLTHCCYHIHTPVAKSSWGFSLSNRNRTSDLPILCCCQVSSLFSSCFPFRTNRLRHIFSLRRWDLMTFNKASKHNEKKRNHLNPSRSLIPWKGCFSFYAPDGIKAADVQYLTWRHPLVRGLLFLKPWFGNLGHLVKWASPLSVPVYCNYSNGVKNNWGNESSEKQSHFFFYTTLSSNQWHHPLLAVRKCAGLRKVRIDFQTWRPQ